MFEWFLAGTWRQVLDFEHGNHHVVSDLLCKLTTGLFGVSNLTLRIPVLLGGLLYSYSIFGISLLLFGEGLLFLFSVAVLSLNPLVLDYLTCARGYGPALGLYFYTLHQVMLYLIDPPARWSRRLLNRAGVALGLSVGCNAIMIFPGGALAACLLLLLLGDSLLRRSEPTQPAQVIDKQKSKKKRHREAPSHSVEATEGNAWIQTVIHMMLPAVAVGGFFLILPKQLLELEENYLGPPSLAAIADGLVRHSFQHSPWGFPGLTALIPAETAIRLFTFIAIPLLLAMTSVAGVLLATRWIRQRNLDSLAPFDRPLLLLAGTLPLAVVMIVVSRHVFQKPYPELRTAMYWIPLLCLACLMLARKAAQTPGLARFLAAPLLAVLALCLLQFVAQFNTRYFAEWAYCAAGKDMMQAIRADHDQKPAARVRVGLSWQLEPVVNFYRMAWGLNWMDPVYRDDPNRVYDYYLLMNDDIKLVELLHLKTLMRDRLSGVVLAKRVDP